MTKKYTYTIILSVLMLSCHKNAHTNQKSVLQTSDCWPERKNDGKVENSKGTILLSAEHFIILSAQDQNRYLPCNLPLDFKKEGITFTFSLITKEIYPNERLLATPSVLTNIELTKN